MAGEPETVANALNPLFSDVVTALMIILIGFMVGKILSIVIIKIFREADLNRKLRASSRKNLDYGKGIAGIVSIITYIVAIVWALYYLKIFTLFIRLVGVALGILVLGSIVLYVFNLFPVIYTSMFFKDFRNIRKGQRLVAGPVSGVVLKKGLFSIKLITRDEEEIRVPATFFKVYKVSIIRNT